MSATQNEASLPSRPSPQSLVTLPGVLQSLLSLESEEAEVSASLAALLASQEPILTALARLRHLTPQIRDLHEDALLLSQRVSSTAKTAERVGGRVRQLDEEMKRVREAGEWVGQALELKSSLASLQSSIEARDWESATRHCARAMALPIDVISGPFAESAVPTSDHPLPPVQTLQTAREQLLAIFLRQFKQASQARDAAATSRFFKLFPPIGWEREGLDAYASFVLELVQTKPPPAAKSSSPLYYVTVLTALFESVCNIVDQHQPVVEKYYGPGKMMYVVGRLIQECDRVVKRFVEGWEEDRSMKRKMAEALTPSSVRKPQSQTNAGDEELVDPREIDKVLTEASAMIMRYTAFRRFLYSTLQNNQPEGEDPTPEALKTTSPLPSPTQRSKGVDPPSDKADHSSWTSELEVVESSGCRQIFDDVLFTYYIPLEVWYLKTTINQAHRMAMSDLSQLPPTTTVPDLAFYLLKSVLYRVLSTGAANAVDGCVRQLKDVMEREYGGVIKRKLDDVYRNTNSSGAGGRGEKVERESRMSFIVHLNDLDISSSHMERLIKDTVSSQIIPQNFLEHDLSSVRSNTLSILTLVPKFRLTLKTGIEQVFNQLMRPRLRTLVTDIYKDVSYVLNEDAYTTAEYQDIVRKRFVRAWEALMDGYKDTFTDSNYRLFFGLAVDVLIRPWEKLIMALKFTDLGAIRFDRDLRAISTYLASQTVFGDAREKFQRLQQISTLLNLDRDEDVDDFFSGSGITWKLSIVEARLVVALKV